MIGPVQVLVVGFDHQTFSGEVIAEFTRLQEAGIVRLVDLLLISRADDGTLHTLTDDKIPANLGRLAAGLLTSAGDDQKGPSPPEQLASSSWSLADAVTPGGTAVVALIEHTWASPLRDAIVRNGGQPLDETWLAPEDLDRLQRLIAETEPAGSPPGR
jgi:Family of unknown function (DUF6325)